MLRKIFFGLLMFASALTVYAADEIYTPWYNNVAIKGYDPVAYFLSDAAVEGESEFEFEWKGATWRFSSKQNLELFAGNPEKYAPQYGGYCAYGITEDALVSIDPSQFSIIDGKLYLNYSPKIQKKWEKQRAEFIDIADKKWPVLLAD